MKVIYVMIGGFFGAICRYSLGQMLHMERFPLGTLVINLIGCLFLGWFLTFASQKHQIKPALVLFIGTGFTGSFTTFSTFSVEIVSLFQDGSVLYGVLYVLLTIIFGIMFAFLGYKLALSNVEKGDVA